MSGFKNPHTPDRPSIRAAAEALISSFDREARTPDEVHPVAADRAAKVEALRSALAEPEVSRADLLERGQWAQEGIELMKAGQPVLPIHIRAIVEAAEAGLQAAGSFGLRWRADMRAIERWRKGDALATDTRSLLSEALSELRDAASFYAQEAVGSAYREASKVAQAIEEHLAEAQPGARELILPDHADLVVWLLGLVDRSVEGLSIDEVGRLADRIGRAGMWHASQGSAHGDSLVGGDVAELIRKLARMVIDADRRAFLAEQRAIPADLEELIAEHLGGELGDSYDCTRVWEAWSVGTMSEEDFEPVRERLGDLAAGLAARIAPFAILGGEPAQASGIGQEPQPVPGVYSEAQGLSELLDGEPLIDTDRLGREG